MNALQLITAQPDEKDSIGSPEEIGDLAGRLSPAFPFFILSDRQDGKFGRGFVQAAHNATQSNYPDGDDRAAFTYVLECSATPDVIHQMFTNDTDTIASFMKSWACDQDDWQSTIEQWNVISTARCIVTPKAESDRDDE